MEMIDGKEMKCLPAVGIQADNRLLDGVGCLVKTVHKGKEVLCLKTFEDLIDLKSSSTYHGTLKWQDADDCVPTEIRFEIDKHVLEQNGETASYLIKIDGNCEHGLLKIAPQQTNTFIFNDKCSFFVITRKNEVIEAAVDNINHGAVCFKRWLIQTEVARGCPIYNQEMQVVGLVKSKVLGVLWNAEWTILKQGGNCTEQIAEREVRGLPAVEIQVGKMGLHGAGCLVISRYNGKDVLCLKTFQDLIDLESSETYYGVLRWDGESRCKAMKIKFKVKKRIVESDGETASYLVKAGPFKRWKKKLIKVAPYQAKFNGESGFHVLTHEKDIVKAALDESSGNAIYLQSGAKGQILKGCPVYNENMEVIGLVRKNMKRLNWDVKWLNYKGSPLTKIVDAKDKSEKNIYEYARTDEELCKDIERIIRKPVSEKDSIEEETEEEEVYDDGYDYSPSSTGVNYIERQETQSLTLPDSDYSDPYEDVYDGDLHETPVPCPSKEEKESDQDLARKSFHDYSEFDDVYGNGNVNINAKPMEKRSNIKSKKNEDEDTYECIDLHSGIKGDADGRTGEQRSFYENLIATKYKGKSLFSRDQYIATRDHKAKEKGQLAFKKGDIITVTMINSSGKCEGFNNDVFGSFPSNFVKHYITDRPPKPLPTPPRGLMRFGRPIIPLPKPPGRPLRLPPRLKRSTKTAESTLLYEIPTNVCGGICSSLRTPCCSHLNQCGLMPHNCNIHACSLPNRGCHLCYLQQIRLQHCPLANHPCMQHGCSLAGQRCHNQYQNQCIGSVDQGFPMRQCLSANQSIESISKANDLVFQQCSSEIKNQIEALEKLKLDIGNHGFASNAQGTGRDEAPNEEWYKSLSDASTLERTTMPETRSAESIEEEATNPDDMHEIDVSDELTADCEIYDNLQPTGPLTRKEKKIRKKRRRKMARKKCEGASEKDYLLSEENGKDNCRKPNMKKNKCGKKALVLEVPPREKSMNEYLTTDGKPQSAPKVAKEDSKEKNMALLNKFFKDSTIESMNTEVRHELAIELDASDWKALARGLGVQEDIIKEISMFRCKGSFPALDFLEDLKTKYPEENLSKFKTRIKEVQRNDVVRIIDSKLGKHLSKRLEEIPVLEFREVMKKLEQKATGMTKNWKDVAGLYNYTHNQINYLGSSIFNSPPKRPTDCLIDYLATSRPSTTVAEISHVLTKQGLNSTNKKLQDLYESRSGLLN